MRSIECLQASSIYLYYDFHLWPAFSNFYFFIDCSPSWSWSSTSGLPLLRFSCGLYSKAIRVISWTLSQSARFISIFIDEFRYRSWLIIRRSSSFVIIFGQNFFRIRRRHLFAKIWSFFLIPFVSFQVSQSHSSTDLTQTLNKRNLYVFDILVLLHILLSQKKVCQVLLIRDLRISISMPPFLETEQPR